MIDVVYFGKSYEEGNPQLLEQQFKAAVQKEVKNIQLTDAYDDIKGYRLSVNVEESEIENYYAFIIGNGWIDCSLTVSLMFLQNKEAKIKKLIEIAKVKYPQNFKQD